MASTVKRVKSKVKYSTMETKLLGLLSREVTSDELIKKLYKDGEAPYYARESITSVLRALMRKVKHNNEPFIIIKTTPGGPYPASYRKENK
jgi:hypothetical protein